MPTETMPKLQASPWWQTGWRRLKGRARSWRPHTLMLLGPPDQADDWAAVAQAFALWCAEHEGQACQLGLSSRWLLTSVAPAEWDADAAYQQATQHWAHYLDLDDAALSAHWVLRQVAVPQANVLTAAPRALIDALVEQAKAHGVRLMWVGPWWARGVQTWLAALSASDEGQVLRTLHLLEPGLVTHVQAHVVAGQRAHLSRVWVETRRGHEAQGEGRTVSLVGPDHQLDALMPYHQHVWDHGLAAQVLRGLDPWQQVAA
jgi:hypothetical protein